MTGFLSSLSSFFNQMLLQTKPVLKPKNTSTYNNNSNYSDGEVQHCDDNDLQVVGGIERMAPQSPLLRTPTSRLNMSHYTPEAYERPFPPLGVHRKRLPGTPYPRGAISSYSSPVTPSRSRTPAILSSSPLFEQTSGGGQLQGDRCHPLAVGSLRVGGNDGLVDLEDEPDDGCVILDERKMDTTSAVAQVRSPGISSFRFRPTVSSTVNRIRATTTSTWKENMIHRPIISSSQRISRVREGRVGKQGRSIGRAGLSMYFQSAPLECYRMKEKQAYEELLSQSSVAQSNCFNRSNNWVAVSKTRKSLEWSNQKMESMESQATEQQINQSKIPLWSLDSQTIPTNKLTTELGVKLTGSESTLGELKQSGKVSKKLKTKAESCDVKDIEDDDIQITKETIMNVVRPNSLEQQMRFIAYHTFTPDWVDNINAQYQKKKLDLDRELRVSELMAKWCLEQRKTAPTAEDIVNRRIKQLSLKHPSPRIEIPEEDELVELTAGMEKVITDALRKHPPGEMLTEKFNIQITRRDIATLQGLNWLNDEVINFYMNLLMERSKNDNFPSVYAFNTFFYPKLLKMGYSGVKRWTKKVDVFSHDLLLIPIHLGMHWCLATINVKDKVICYYDSMLGSNNQCLQELQKYLQDEHQDKKKTLLDFSGWQCETLKDIPQQMNGSDCGMFACKFSEYLSRNRPITFTQDHMPYFRRRMVYEIVSNKLL